MRPVEIALSCMVLAGSALLLGGLPIGLPAIAGFLSLLALLSIVHVLYEGPHWQLVPLYLAEAAFFALGIAALVARHVDLSPLELRLVGSILLVLALAALLLSWLLPMFRLPNPSGPYPVGTRLLYIVDPKRDAEGGLRGRSERELMVQVWYPAEAVTAPREVYRRLVETTLRSSYQSVLRTQSLRDAPLLASSAPYPLLVFSPAWTGQRTQSTFLMQELASHGFVVASIDHTYYSGLVAFPDGRVMDGRMAPALGDFTHLSIEEGKELASQFVTILAEDILFVAEEMTARNEKPGGEWYGRLDMDRVGALGHSLGGAAATEACRLDPRIKAALNLDGWTFGEVLSQGLAKPWMVVYGKGIEVEPRDLAAQPEGIQRYWQMNRENYAAVAAALQQGRGYCVKIEGASHWNFSDRALYSRLRSQTQAGTIPPQRAHRIIAELARAFFAEAFAGGERGPVGGVAGNYPEVVMIESLGRASATQN